MCKQFNFQSEVCLKCLKLQIKHQTFRFLTELLSLKKVHPHWAFDTVITRNM